MPLFAGVPEAEIERLAAAAEELFVPAGRFVYSEGDSPDFFYVVVSGRLRVTSNGALRGYVGRLEPVGEMGVVTGEPRTSNVHAMRDSLCLRIAREPLLAMFTRQGPALMA